MLDILNVNTEQPAESFPRNMAGFPTPVPREEPVSSSDGNPAFELGKACFKSGDLKNSIPLLMKAKQLFIRENSLIPYFDCYGLLFHALSEQCRTEELEDTQKEFQIIRERNNLDISPRNLIMMSFYSVFFNKNQGDVPFLLDKAMKMILKRQKAGREKNDRLGELESSLNIMYCLYAYTFHYYKTRQLGNCRRELQSINLLLEDHFNLEERIREEKSRTDDLQEQKSLAELLQAVQQSDPFVRELSAHLKYMSALIEENCVRKEELLQESFEKVNNGNPLAGYIYTGISKSYLQSNVLNQAGFFLSLAEQHTNTDDFKRLEREIVSVKTEIESRKIQTGSRDYDMIFNKRMRTVLEKQKGRVSFKNQNILWNILNLLISCPGKAVSKKTLVESVWKQSYNPLLHDNKVYVTLKRLREMVEQNSRRPVYIQRDKTGYYLPEDIKILIK